MLRSTISHLKVGYLVHGRCKMDRLSSHEWKVWQVVNKHHNVSASGYCQVVKSITI